MNSLNEFHTISIVFEDRSSMPTKVHRHLIVSHHLFSFLAALTSTDKNISKKKSLKFETEAGLNNPLTTSFDNPSTTQIEVNSRLEKFSSIHIERSPRKTNQVLEVPIV